MKNKRKKVKIIKEGYHIDIWTLVAFILFSILVSITNYIFSDIILQTAKEYDVLLDFFSKYFLWFTFFFITGFLVSVEKNKKEEYVLIEVMPDENKSQ